MDTKDNDSIRSITDEIAAAEAELKAAQKKLEAAKAKAAEDDAEGSSVEDAAPAAAVAGVVASGPVELEAEPVTDHQPAVGDPDWVAVGSDAAAQHTAPQEPAAAASQAYTPPAQPAEPAQGQPQNPYAQPQGDYYWQQPQGSTQYGQPQDPYGQPQNPYGQQQPYYQQPYAPVVSPKDHVAAGLLAIFLGSLGIHKFYLGYNSAGFIMLAVTILGGIVTLGIASAVMGLIAFIEGILYLVKSQSEFEQIYVFNKREWF